MFFWRIRPKLSFKKCCLSNKIEQISIFTINYNKFNKLKQQNYSRKEIFTMRFFEKYEFFILQFLILQYFTIFEIHKNIKNLK